MNKTDKTFSVKDEKVLEYAFQEAIKNGKSSSYLAKAFNMEDGREYQISWQIKKMKDVNVLLDETGGKE